jgi:hypothetical protein
MKPKPAVFAALIIVAVIVSNEFAAVTDHAARVGGSWLARARLAVVREINLCVVKAAARVVVHEAKS